MTPLAALALCSAALAADARPPGPDGADDNFAAFLWMGIDNRRASGDALVAARAEFRDRVLNARKYWGKGLAHFTVLLEPSATARALLNRERCDQEPQAPAPFEEYTCTGHGVDAFSAVLVPCQGNPQVWSYLDNPLYGCKFDRAVDYAFHARAERFGRVAWFAIGDDDVAYSRPVLRAFLDHYDPTEKIVLNPAAGSDEEQRRAAGPGWNQHVRACNANIPERFMGSVYSRGLLDASKAEHARGVLEHLCAAFGGAQDTVQGLLWWLHGAQFLPLGRPEVDTGSAANWTLAAAPAEVMMAHRVRTEGDFAALEAEAGRLYPRPEALPGPAYAQSANALQNGSAFTLTEANCKPPTGAASPAAGARRVGGSPRRGARTLLGALRRPGRPAGPQLRRAPA